MSRRRRELALVFALVFGAVGGASRVAATNVPFTTRPAISESADFARFVYAADIDGDGDLDGLSASTLDDTVAWHENVNGDGSLWAEEIVSAVADYANSVFAADVDGDGNVDVLSSSTLDSSITWYENAGGGTGWAATTISSLASGASSVHAADIDGDGDVDVLSASVTDDTVAWYRNEVGDGSSWSTELPIAIGSSVANGAISVFAADVDGDGDLDVAWASLQDNRIAWHENVGGSGTSWTLRTVFTTADGARSVFAGDIDGDGDLDLVSSSGTDDRVRWHENLNGLGTSWSTATISTAADLPAGVFVADVDGDGDLDALSASRADNEVAWYENVAGDGSSWTRRLLSTLAERAYSVFAGDVDGDGDVDVLSASADDDEIAWYENRTIHRSALLEEKVTIAASADEAMSVFAADVDGDGHLDVLSASLADDKIAWYENASASGDGTSWTPRTITNLADGAYSVFAADVDGDGDIDALSASISDSEIAWHENAAANGSGTSWTPQTIASALAVSVFAADVDGDGDVDALAALPSADQVAWYENASASGDGSSWLTRTISIIADEPKAVFAADVDGDGHLDVLAASASDDTIAWHKNEPGSPDPTWTPFSISTTAGGARSVFAGDLDGDGDLDALSGTAEVSSVSRVLWHENTDPDGDGTSWTEHTIASGLTGSFGVRSVFAADLDRDGDLDVLSASENDDKVAWYENVEGDGSSWAPHTVVTTADRARAVFAGDVDGDGDLDALSASHNDNTIAWYPNRGGQFALPTTALGQGVLGNSQEDVELQIDLAHRGRAGDSDVELQTIELLFEDGSGSPLTGTQANALIAKLELFLDDGSGVFEFPGDTLVALLDPLILVSGVQSIDLVVGDPDVQVAFGEGKRYFVVVTMTANAESQTPSSFELFHLTEASSTARDASAPAVPLRLEYHADTTTGLVDSHLTSATCKAPFDLDLRGFIVYDREVVCEAGTTIRAGNGVVVHSNGDLTLRAGQQVRFVSDFSVKNLGKLTVEIDPSLEP